MAELKKQKSGDLELYCDCGYYRHTLKPAGEPGELPELDTFIIKTLPKATDGKSDAKPDAKPSRKRIKRDIFGLAIGEEEETEE